jgi:hypothetical protein
MRLKLVLGLAPVASALAAAVTVYAATEAPLRAPTYMYVGNKLLGSLVPQQTSAWSEDDCLSYTGASVYANRKRSWINVQYFDGQIAGYARTKTPRIWLIFKRALIGTAMQRNATRWDVFRRNGLKWGHTRGPDGPEAAAMLLLICGASP